LKSARYSVRLRSPGNVEGVAGIEADGLVLWGVIDVVLAGEFELTLIVVPIESHASFWKRRDKRIRGAVLELLHDPNFGKQMVGLGGLEPPTSPLSE
jgi:hypothetical protein